MSEEKPRLMATSSNGYTCYSDDHHVSSTANHHHHHMINHHLQTTFDQAPEIYNLTANMEILGFPSKNLQDQAHWNKGFFTRPSSSKDHEFYSQHELTAIPDHTITYLDESLRSTCVFPCEGNERPSQGLSLSLSSSNPSSIGLQSFELRQNDEQFSITNSKYLGPAQELLNEFCNIGTKEIEFEFKSKMKVKKMSEFEGENISDAQKQSLYSLDFLELQKRKTRLIQMLEEVDRRYKHYCNQMRAVVQPFESVAGNGAALVYSSMASRAMSRHFRCLKDGILNQIKAIKKALGDKDSAAPGTIKGETPRLRVLDQTLRQQKALQQMSLMESHPWRPQRGLPERSVSVLRAWLFEHFLHPYPSDVDKHILARQTGLSRSQVSNWFINARVRLWKPMVEEMYLEELKDQEPNLDEQNNHNHSDQKPTHDQLVIDSESLSSIINRNDGKKIQNLPGNSSYGAMEMDFSSYNHHQPHGGATTVYGGGGVSLTLGLHQNGGNNASTSQGSLFYRDEMEECQTVQYSLLDSENQTNYLPYRNLMGAQLLHDLAG